MPKRTNDFQRLVYLVQLNLAAGATVTESKMMRDRRTKKLREVDVCIKGHVGSHPVTVCVECRDHQRIADVGWVDAMKAKHERLDTNALILCSRSGFTSEARNVAKEYRIQTFTLEDVDKADFAALFGETGSLWIKTFEVSAEKVSVKVGAAGNTPAETVATTPRNFIHAGDGTLLCEIRELVDKVLESEQVRDFFLKQAKEEHIYAEIIWEPSKSRLFMKKLQPEVLKPIEAVRIVGPCKLEVSKFGLRHSKLGDVHVVWGKASIAGKDAFAVKTVSPSGEKKLSINFSTPAPNLKNLPENLKPSRDT